MGNTSKSEYLYTIRQTQSGEMEYAADGQYEDASKIGELAKEAESLIAFVNETTIEGFSNLADTSREYKEAAERISEMMERFSDITERIQTNISSIKESADAVNRAVEEAANGVADNAERSVEMSDNISRIDEEASASSEISGELNARVSQFKLE